MGPSPGTGQELQTLKLMDGDDGPAGDEQEGWNVSISSQVLVLHVSYQLRCRMLVAAWALTARFHASVATTEGQS